MTERLKARRTALGVRCHSGWAAVILATGTREKLEVLHRSRIELYDASIEGSKQPFHAAEPMPIARAEAFLARCQRTSDALASAAIEWFLAKAEPGKLFSCGMLSASGRKLPPLKEILASHALIHAAEGEFYRDCVVRACVQAGVPVVRVRERDALRQAADATGRSERELKEEIAVAGKSLGTPWAADQKLAALAAWITLR